MSFNPTPEQNRAVELALTGGSLAIEALAGAGKTSTLRLVADALAEQGKTCLYIAFNKKIVTDAQRSFGDNVTCKTAHSLAMGAVGRTLRHKLDSSRMSWEQIARALGLDPTVSMVFGVEEETIEIPMTKVAAIVAQTVGEFCRTADPVITERHVPFKRGLDKPGEFENNAALRARVVPLAQAYWEDVSSPGGRFRFEHNHYLKLWQLTGPKVNADVILFDEAQDANPLMMDIVEQQKSAQRIWVGDRNQMIYAWNGAVNAMELADVEHRAELTTSFRFGPEIAEAANVLLARLNGPKVTGDGKPGRVGPVDDPDVYLGRTNGAVIERALALMEQGQRVFVQGGVREVVWFAESALALMSGAPAAHPDLDCFPSWEAVQRYTESEDGQDLRTMVRIVDTFGPEQIISGLGDATSNEAYADVAVSTAHKSKGAEWGSVALLGDFPAGDAVGEDELRLLYVAATRAKAELDPTMVDLDGTAEKA